MLHGATNKNIREGVNLLRSSGPTTALRLLARAGLNRGRDTPRWACPPHGRTSLPRCPVVKIIAP